MGGFSFVTENEICSGFYGCGEGGFCSFFVCSFEDVGFILLYVIDEEGTGVTHINYIATDGNDATEVDLIVLLICDDFADRVFILQTINQCQISVRSPSGRFGLMEVPSTTATLNT